MSRKLLWSACLLLILNLCGMGFSLWSVLFGPWNGVFFGLAGFFVGFCGLALANYQWAVARFSGHWTGLLPNSRFATVIPRVTKIGGVIAVLTLAVMFLAARSEGVTEQGPALAQRQKYLLNSHGQETEVSRLRYSLVGASFFVTWHLVASLPSFYALQVLLFGKPASVDRRRL